MSLKFKPNKPFRDRCSKLVKIHGPKLLAEIKRIVDGGEWIVPKEQRLQLKKKFGFKNDKELMVVMASSMKEMAVTPISSYQVPIVGLEKESGDLIIGWNVEFLAANLSVTIHAEQFLFSRSYQRGTTISEFALAEPMPCGHCRQFIWEFAGADKITVTNMKGYSLKMKDILPLGFGPSELGRKGITRFRKNFDLEHETDELATAALDAANRSYAPYTETASGIALKTKDNAIFTGSYVENVAFNPSLSPMQSAIIELLANSRRFDEIVDAALVQSKGSIDQRAEASILLSIMAPRVRLNSLLV